jgi:hypothetical protein
MVTISNLAAWDRVMNAIEQVRDRLLRATAALERAHVPYVVIGGNAVSVWVGRKDPAAVRFTQDVDLALRRTDLDAARAALEAAGFVYRHAAGVDMFLDGPDTKAREAVHVIFSGEKVRPEYILPVPDVAESEADQAFQVLSLEALVRMKLTSFRRKDQVHLQDMLSVGLIDETWKDRFPPELAARLQEILDNPEG